MPKQNPKMPSYMTNQTDRQIQWFNYESINRNLLDYFDLKSILDLKMPSYTTNHVTSYITNLPVYQPAGKQTGKLEMYIIHGSMIQLWVNWQYILYLVQWFNYESINRNLLDYFDLKSILDLKMPSYTTNHSQIHKLN